MKITYKAELKPGEEMTAQEVTEILLKNRGITDTKEFFQPKPPALIQLSDFGFKEEIQKVLKIMHELMENQKMIVVYTDYDADGITGGTILWETLSLLGFNAMPYVPHRQKEGYGFSKLGIDNAKKEHDPALIISVDHGITAIEQIAYAKSIGIPVIVTDHHLKGDTIPETAEAIFHIPALSGAGVAYFFAKLLFEEFTTPGVINSSTKPQNAALLKDHFHTDYVALAAIGGIADLVPLVGPTRSIVKYGLAACSRSKRVGICHLLKEAKIDGKQITPYEVGFIIAPRINAIGRLEHAMDALRLLCTPRAEKAQELAGKIGQINVDRQELVKKAVEEAKIQVENMSEVPNIIVLTSETWHEGIIGLIASKMTELYYRPTIVMTKNENTYKGSARSIPSFHITNFMRDLKEYLLGVGGHAQAGGFSLDEKNLGKFMKAIEKEGKKRISEKDLERIIQADLKIPLSKVTYNLVRQLEKMQPFGIGNPQPTFFSQAKVLEAKTFGKKSDHLKIVVQEPETRSYPFEVIAFSAAERVAELSRDKVIEMVYQTEINRWGVTETVRGRLVYF